jgi:uncharacterized protein (DUF488 family)
MPGEVLTIGAYGFTAETFFAALADARPSILCDIRRRRGVRGAEYAFANSGRLQERLAELGIGYEHRLDLAPSPELRAAQAAADAAAGMRKRMRAGLSDAFVTGYAAECLAGFDAARFLADHAAGPVCLFCVEREPTACHRSLVADHLAAQGATVRHLTP